MVIVKLKFFLGGGEWALSKLDSEKRSRHPSGAQFSNQKSVVETLIVIQIKEVFLCCCCCCCVLLPEVHLYRSLCAAVDLGVYFSARYPWNDVHVVGEGKSKVALHGRVVRGRAALWTFIHEARAHYAILTLNTGVLPHHPTAPRVCQGIRLAVQNLISNIYVTVHKSDV